MANIVRISAITNANTCAGQLSLLMPTPPPVQPVEPEVQLFLFIGGQQYGPYDWKTCKQFVPTGQLTPQTMVWEQGMAAWTPAGQVPKLAALFAPVAPSTPPMPPMGGPTPPPMMG